MSEKICVSCSKPKANRTCSLCQAELCKSCTQFLDEGSFSFRKTVSEDLSHSTYCHPCFDETVAPALADYDEVMERAKKIYVFYKTQRKPIPLLKRAKERVDVKNCPDKNETLLRLAFFAAEESYNAIVDVDVFSEKMRNKGFEKSNYQGSCVPAQIDASKMYWDRDRFQEE